VDFELPPKIKAKETSVNYEKFVEEHADDVFELEAIPPEDLQEILRQPIDGVIDIDKFNREIDREKKDATFLEATRREVYSVLSGIAGEEEERASRKWSGSHEALEVAHASHPR